MYLRLQNNDDTSYSNLELKETFMKNLIPVVLTSMSAYLPDKKPFGIIRSFVGEGVGEVDIQSYKGFLMEIRS